MKTKQVNITEENFELKDSRNMIFKVIDCQINNYKLQFLTDWEKNHSISSAIKDSKIAALEAKKRELADLYKAHEFDNSLVDLNISIDVRIKEELSIAI